MSYIKIAIQFLVWLIVGLAQIHLLCCQNVPKYSNEFLSIGVSARALGMGNTQVAIVNDVTSAYWNPAGLLQIKDKYNVSLMHAEQFGGIAQFDYAGFATPIDSLSHLAVSVIRFGVDDIPDTRFLYDANGNINYDNIQFFNSADYAFLFSYARKIKKLHLGANFKVIYRNAGNFANAFGFGIDLGGIYKVKSWSFGLMARDITTTFNAWTHNSSLVFDVFSQTGNVIPKNTIELTLPKLIFGFAKSFNINKKLNLLTSMDWNTTFDGERNVLIKSSVVSIDPSIGLELNYDNLLFFRSGINNYQQIKNFDGSTYFQSQLNFGLGILIKNIAIDYALNRLNIDSEGSKPYSNIFSLRIGFGK